MKFTRQSERLMTDAKQVICLSITSCYTRGALVIQWLSIDASPCWGW